MSYWNITAKTSGAHSRDIEHVMFAGHRYSLAGRVVSFRRQGGIAFGHLYDGHGKLQFCFQRKLLGDKLKEWSEQIQLGVHIGIEGEFNLSSTGEPTLFVSDFKLLQKVWTSFPDKFNGITGAEIMLRKRYLDCIFDPELNNVFRTRSKMISTIRSILNDWEFLEFETPILTPRASGAQAKPFVTHHNALDADLFLRIAPETYLKRVVAAGYNRVFEIGKQFRNEGIDPSHLQEFTSLEWYAAYWNYMDNLHMFHNQVLPAILGEVSSFDTEDYYLVNYQGSEFVFEHELETRLYRDVFHAKLGIYPDSFTAKKADSLFKSKVRPTIFQPTYLIDYPAHMSPMAARKSDDANTVEQWQLIINGWEIVKCYTELTDPVLQRQLLEEQAQQRQSGDEEAMALEEDFLECMEHGMPPMSGLGLGIDRLVCLLTNQTSLKDVIMFPTLLNQKS